MLTHEPENSGTVKMVSRPAHGLQREQRIGGGNGMKVSLLGPVGSGKGTQAQLVSGRLNYARISTGDLVRDQIEAGPVQRGVGPGAAAGRGESGAGSQDAFRVAAAG